MGGGSSKEQERARRGEAARTPSNAGPAAPPPGGARRTTTTTTTTVHGGPPPPGAAAPPPGPPRPMPQHLTVHQRMPMHQSHMMAPPAPRVASVGEAERVKNLCAVDIKSVGFDTTHSTLRFATNTLVAAEMEIHTCVRVDVMSGSAVMITPNKPKAPPKPIHVEAAPHKDHNLFLDLENSVEQERMYLKEYPKQVPVVVTLRYKTEDGSHQAEHSFIQLLPEPKLIMQLLEIKGNVYKVEHLYGAQEAVTASVADPASPGGVSDVVEGTEEDLCVICLTNQKDTTVIPCMHQCLCKECADELRTKSPKCPVCRGPINQLVAMKK